MFDLDSLLDTDVLSQHTKLRPDERVFQWMQNRQASELYLSVVSLMEVRFGIEEMPKGRRRDDFGLWLTRDLPRMFANRILAVDERVADEAGRLTAAAKRKGAKPDLADVLIAATARVHRLQLATLNRRHFEKFDIELVEF